MTAILLCMDSVAIIGHLQLKVSGIATDGNANIIGVAMPNRITHSLLNNPQQLQCAFGIQMFEARLSGLQAVNLAMNTASCFE
jgi:hypothetical protein